MLRLYSYWRSSASYRVRIVLNLKGLAHEIIPVDLSDRAHRQERYLARTPEGFVPMLDDHGELITQSMAICEYLEQIEPQPTLIPGDARMQAEVRSLCQVVACDIHPLNNLRVLNALRQQFSATEGERQHWYRHWVETGFEALEARLENNSGRYSVGDTPTLADCFLIPQMYNARRFDAGLDRFPRLLDIERHCLDLEAFRAAAPDQQADARAG